MKELYRKESDSVGTLDVPVDAYYGVQSLRGRNNFYITGRGPEKAFIYNIVKIKKAAAKTNFEANVISEDIANAIIKACDEILDGKYYDAFITDAIQGGAGTTFNMNVNEVVANVATEKLGGKKGTYICHPNDHVNCGQSTNDVIPTAGKLTVIELSSELFKVLGDLVKSLRNKEKEFDDVIKMGRTQLEDAVPIRLGQEFGAYACGVERNIVRLKSSIEEMHILNIGGTAIGTCINASKEYVQNMYKELSKETGFDLELSNNLIDATQNLDSFAAISGDLKALALTLSKMCNDLRLMNSGPKDGLGEITLPAKQNGSSIMPGKINPVIPEVVNQVAFNVVGNDACINMAVEAGQLELNAFEPVIFNKLFDSITTLTNAIKTLIANCIDGIKANKERCYELLMSSVGIVTALAPYIGYKKSADLAHEALDTNRKIKDLVLEKGLMDEATLDKVLDPYKMTEI